MAAPTRKQIYDAVGAILALAEIGVHLTESTKDDAVVARLKLFYEQLAPLVGVMKVGDDGTHVIDPQVDALVREVCAACPCDDEDCPCGGDVGGVGE